MGADFVQKKGKPSSFFHIWKTMASFKTNFHTPLDFQDRLEFTFFLSFSTFPENWTNLRIMSDKGHSDAPSSSRG